MIRMLEAPLAGSRWAELGPPAGPAPAKRGAGACKIRPRLLPTLAAWLGRRPQAAALTSILRTLRTASADFGSLTVSTPFLKVASILSGSMPGGRRSTR